MDIIIGSQMLLSVVYTTTIFARGITILGRGGMPHHIQPPGQLEAERVAPADTLPDGRPRSLSMGANAGTGMSDDAASAGADS